MFLFWYDVKPYIFYEYVFPIYGHVKSYIFYEYVFPMYGYVKPYISTNMFFLCMDMWNHIFSMNMFFLCMDMWNYIFSTNMFFLYMGMWNYIFSTNMFFLCMDMWNHIFSACWIYLEIYAYWMFPHYGNFYPIWRNHFIFDHCLYFWFQLAHEVLGYLQKTENSWLVDVLFAFNSGEFACCYCSQFVWYLFVCFKWTVIFWNCNHLFTIKWEQCYNSQRIYCHVRWLYGLF